jgi:hypothetical protein
LLYLYPILFRSGQHHRGIVSHHDTKCISRHNLRRRVDPIHTFLSNQIFIKQFSISWRYIVDIILLIEGCVLIPYGLSGSCPDRVRKDEVDVEGCLEGRLVETGDQSMGSIRLEICVYVLFAYLSDGFSITDATVVIIVEFIPIMNCDTVGPGFEISAGNHHQLTSRQISRDIIINSNTDNLFTQKVNRQNRRNSRQLKINLSQPLVCIRSLCEG